MTLRSSPPIRFLALACVSALAACAVLQTRPPMPISEVVTLSNSAASPEQVITRVRESRTTYALRGSDFAKLAGLGVPDPVLDELQQSLANDVDRLTRYWVLGESLGACSVCYPQLVDLSSLQAGGNGMADAGYLGAYYSFARPPGVPEWVPAYPGKPVAKMIWIDDIERMLADRLPAEQIASTIQDSRLRHVVGDGSLRVSTQFTVALKGSEFAALARSGASDPVLDALQEKYLAEFVEFARLRHQNKGKGGPQP